MGFFRRRQGDEQRKAMFARMREAMGRVTPQNRRELARSALLAGIGTGVVIGGLKLARRNPGALKAVAGGGILAAGAFGNLSEDMKRALNQARSNATAKAAHTLARANAVKRNATEAARTLGGTAAEKTAATGINWATIAAEDYFRRRIDNAALRISQNLASLAGSAQRVATEKAFRQITEARTGVASGIGHMLSPAELDKYREHQRELLNKIRYLESTAAAPRVLRKRDSAEMREASDMLANIIRAKPGRSLRLAAAGIVEDEDMAAVLKAFPNLNTAKEVSDLLNKTTQKVKSG